MAVDTTQIVPLSADMTGPDFVDQLNVNLNLAAQSNSSEEQPGNRDSTEQEQPSGIKKTIYLQMQLGLITTTYKGNILVDNDVRRPGYIVRFTTQMLKTMSFRKYCHTVLMIGIENCKVKDIKINNNETLYIFYYDSNCEYKGYENGTNVQTILETVYSKPKEDRCYIKIMVKGSTDYAILRQLEVTIEGEYTLVKNKTPEAGVIHYFTFATGYPSKAETETTAIGAYLGAASNEGKNNDTICYDNGYIVLPPNYSQEGVPVPLILFCHGTGGFSWNNNGNATKKVARIRKFLANNGYAVCDCSHLTNNYTSFNDSICLPSITSTIASLIRFIQMNYNVETDGIYVTGKSAGGFACMLLPQIEGFKVKAAAGLATTIFPFMKFYNGGNMVKEDSINKAYREALWEQYNITEIEDKEETGISNIHSYNAYVNASKLRRHDPLLKSTNITTEELQTLIKYYYKSGKKYLTDFITAAENGSMGEEVKQKIVNIVNKIKITFNCPIKIWHSQNDEAAGCVMSELFVEWCKRGGTPAYFRKLNPIVKPEDEDEPYITAHNLVDEINEDGKTNATQTIYHTKYGGDVIETVAICEMVDWFNQW